MSGALMATAGGLFLLAGVLRRFQEPLWLVLGLTFLLLGIAILRSRNQP